MNNNILFLARKLDRDGGGSNKSLHLLTQELSSRGYDVELATINSKKNNIHGLSNITVHEYNAAGSHINELQKTHKIIKKHESVDIVHVFNPSLFPGAGIYKSYNNLPIVGRLNHYSVFCTNPNLMKNECYNNCKTTDKYKHDDDHNWRKIIKSPKYAFRSHILPDLSNQLDLLFALSPAVKRIFKKNGFDDIRVIPNFVDSSIRPETTENNSQDHLVSDILYVGRLLKSKGVHLIIRAVDKLDKNHTVNIVGDGPELENLKSLARSLSVSDQINFQGWVDYDKLPQFYKRTSVFVHPGIWPEPFGRTTIEALQFRTPCIVSNIGGPPWIARNAALTFEPGNATDLSDKLKLLLEDDNIQQKLRSNCVEALDRFRMDTVVNNLEDAYQIAIKNQ